MKNLILAIFALLTLTAAAQAALKGEEVSYTAGDTQLKGYLVVNENLEGKRPGVLVVHEWWGLNTYARERARMLAELGYTALAVDMYGDGKTAEHPSEAGQFATAVRKNLPVAKERFAAALDMLKQQPSVNPDQIAAIGYCFGGAVVLEMARAGLDLRGVASFHGSLTTENPARPNTIKGRILVLNGADDPMITAEDIAAFKAEMDAVGVDYRFINYPGATHSFTSPAADELGKKFDLPLAYNAEADAASWRALQDFFQEIFR